MNERREAIRRQCQELGLAGAKAELILVSDESLRRHFLEWIADEEDREAKRIEAQQRLWNEQAIDAARLSAEASREAAIASKRSAFWTMWAAIATAATALVPILQAKGWLPHQ